VQDVFRIWRNSLFDPVTQVIVAAVIMIATVSGPFGTLEALEPFPRLFFWGGIIVLAATLGIFVRVAMRLYFPDESKIMAEVATTVLFSVIFGAALTFWVSVFAYFFDAADYVPPWWKLIGYVVLLTVALLALRTFIINTVNEKADAEHARKLEAVVAGVSNSEAEEKAVLPRLLHRLPEEDRAPVTRLTSNDHLVDVHTEIGTFSLRMRLKDAIAEMEGVDGYCTHRSHWVARSAIAQAERLSGSRWQLKLTNGDIVPVSRKCQSVLEEAGILDRLAAE